MEIYGTTKNLRISAGTIILIVALLASFIVATVSPPSVRVVEARRW
jgi:hypothetical protein